LAVAASALAWSATASAQNQPNPPFTAGVLPGVGLAFQPDAATGGFNYGPGIPTPIFPDVWVGSNGVSGQWKNPANWSLGIVPLGGVILGPTSPATPPQVPPPPYEEPPAPPQPPLLQLGTNTIITSEGAFVIYDGAGGAGGEFPKNLNTLIFALGGGNQTPPRMGGTLFSGVGLGANFAQFGDGQLTLPEFTVNSQLAIQSSIGQFQLQSQLNINGAIGHISGSVNMISTGLNAGSIFNAGSINLVKSYQSFIYGQQVSRADAQIPDNTSGVFNGSITWCGGLLGPFPLPFLYQQITPDVQRAIYDIVPNGNNTAYVNTPFTRYVGYSTGPSGSITVPVGAGVDPIITGGSFSNLQTLLVPGVDQRIYPPLVGNYCRAIWSGVAGVQTGTFNVSGRWDIGTTVALGFEVEGTPSDLFVVDPTNGRYLPDALGRRIPRSAATSLQPFVIDPVTGQVARDRSGAPVPAVPVLNTLFLIEGGPENVPFVVNGAILEDAPDTPAPPAVPTQYTQPPALTAVMGQPPPPTPPPAPLLPDGPILPVWPSGSGVMRVTAPMQVRGGTPAGGGGPAVAGGGLSVFGQLMTFSDITGPGIIALYSRGTRLPSATTVNPFPFFSLWYTDYGRPGTIGRMMIQGGSLGSGVSGDGNIINYNGILDFSGESLFTLNGGSQILNGLDLADDVLSTAVMRMYGFAGVRFNGAALILNRGRNQEAPPYGAYDAPNWFAFPADRFGNPTDFAVAQAANTNGGLILNSGALSVLNAAFDPVNNPTPGIASVSFAVNFDNNGVALPPGVPQPPGPGAGSRGSIGAGPWAQINIDDVNFQFSTVLGSVVPTGGNIVPRSGALDLTNGNLGGGGYVIANIRVGGTVFPQGNLATNNLTVLPTGVVRFAIGDQLNGTSRLLVNNTFTLQPDEQGNAAQLELQLAPGFDEILGPDQTFEIVRAQSFTTGAAGTVNGYFVGPNGPFLTGGRITTIDGLGSFVVNYGTGSLFPTNLVVLSNYQPSTIITNVFRLYYPAQALHYFTIDVNEYLVNQTRGWQAEGVAFRAFRGPGSLRGVQAVPLYRFFNVQNSEHHYTIDPIEYQALLQNPTVLRPEGVAAYVWNTQVPGTVPVYRLRLDIQGANATAPYVHLFTTDQNERDTLVGLGWVDEGISCYVLRPTRPLQ
jgi:hypothetical protein